MDKLLLRIPEVMEATGWSRAHLYKFLGRPDGIPVVKVGRTVRVPANALKEWVAAQIEGSAPSWDGQAGPR